MSHDDHSHSHDPHGGHGGPHDGGHGGQGYDARTAGLFSTAANPPPAGAADHAERAIPASGPPRGLGPSRSDEGITRPIGDSDYFSTDPAVVANISAHIDEYFNQPLDIFPFWETEGKPDRFHVLFARQIEERFPAEQDIRSRIHAYGRGVFRALLVHIGVKRLSQAAALVGLTLMATLGPNLFAQWTGTPAMGLALAGGGMLAVLGAFWALNAILFIQYRFRLENDSYELSREIVQRTREIQNLFTNARALSDQAETQFQQDGKGWGQRAMFLTRLTMWLGARMEYLEKHVQMELWRVRRERYWMRWVGRIITPAVLLVWLAIFALEPVPGSQETAFRALQGGAVLIGLIVSWLSYFRWQTPVTTIQDKLGVDGWVRYASLDVDNAVGEQVRRDKERLVEYRALTRGGR
ncbi:hypothetical protein GGQ87_003007 [Brevundimonas alba]|uniref:Uncharacterized protein n=1 Tax=Brevundimonas alba TaxID=74314 RepID=A0A7X6BPR2_9CAUL|nr:hypothetical protein [Brevundimonas alba]NJC42712.1 hypothetical protein [Brevundimonas alba]